MLRLGAFRLIRRLQRPLPVFVVLKIIHNFQYVMNNFRNLLCPPAEGQGAAQVRRLILSQSD
jgi:hypothetical protein